MLKKLFLIIVVLLLTSCAGRNNTDEITEEPEVENSPNSYYFLGYEELSKIKLLTTDIYYGLKESNYLIDKALYINAADSADLTDVNFYE